MHSGYTTLQLLLHRVRLRRALWVVAGVVFGVCGSSRLAAQVGTPASTFAANHYTSNDFQASPVVFGVATDANGLVYAANNEGVLHFDGLRWQLFATPKPARSIVLTAAGRVLVGCVNDIGHLALQPNGTLRYESLLGTLPEDQKEVGECFRLIAQGNLAAALTTTGLYVVDISKDPLLALKRVSGPVNTAAADPQAGQVVTYLSGGKGLHSIGLEGLQRLPQSPTADHQVIAMARLGQSWVLATSDDKLLRTQGSELQELTGSGVERLQADRLYDLTSLPGANLLGVATERGGALLLDATGNLVAQYAKPQGLPDNNLFCIAASPAGDVWLGHTLGLSQILTAEPLRRLQPYEGFPNQVTSLSALGGNVWVGTLGGLYRLSGTSVVKLPVPDVEYGETLPIATDTLLAAGGAGLLLIVKDKVIDKIDAPCARLLRVNGVPNEFLVGFRSSVETVELRGGKLVKVGAAYTLPAMPLSQTYYNGQVLTGTFGEGGYLLQEAATKRSEALPEQGIVQAMAFGPSALMVRQGNRFTWRTGAAQGTFQPAGVNLASAFLLSASGNRLALATADGLLMVSQAGDSVTVVGGLPTASLKQKPQAGVFVGGGFLAAYGNRLLYWPALEPVAGEPAPLRLTGVAYVVAGADSLVSGGFSMAESGAGYGYVTETGFDLPTTVKALRIQYALADLRYPASVRYRYRTDSGVWSDWSLEGSVVVTDLKSGSHTLTLQAQDAFGRLSEKQLRYTVPTPWYLSTYAYAGYGALALAVVFLFVRVRSRRLELENHQLNVVINERTKEITQQKRQIEAQVGELNSINQQLSGVNLALNDKNRELDQALEELKATQDQLLQNEKMAALGQLVAGVAHEINTPVGVGVTAASHLHSKSKEINQLMEAGQMKKSDLSRYLEQSLEGTNIILTNLSRAAELIQSFKKVAVDQNVEEPTDMSLKGYLDEIINSLKPSLRDHGVKIEVSGDPDVRVYAVASAISQTMINLIMNAIHHAFAGRKDGVVKVHSGLNEEGMAFFTVEDNGKGMNEEVKRKIFEPFFTTNRSKGGSGLGMHIVYNLVANSLKGTIAVESTEGEGTKFTITFATR
ncbi:MAG: HAMP domain-containing sensor histidine kinase [Bacteroidia bacterium]|nr:HAMP domain-containing sensor histidine kinase [Bacteroidia bacterium]